PPFRSAPGRRCSQALLAAALLLVARPGVARAELALGLRVGQAWPQNSDLRLTRPGGTDVTLRDVSWDDDSFGSPPYFGIDLSWWGAGGSPWAFGLDLTHAKAILVTDETVLAQGRLGGVPVDGPRVVGEVLPRLQLSHGLDFVTGNV